MGIMMLKQSFNSINRFIRTLGGSKQLVCLRLAGAILLPYLQVKDHGFVTWDDDQYITQNHEVQAGLTWLTRFCCFCFGPG